MKNHNFNFLGLGFRIASFFWNTRPLGYTLCISKNNKFRHILDLGLVICLKTLVLLVCQGYPGVIWRVQLIQEPCRNNPGQSGKV